MRSPEKQRQYCRDYYQRNRDRMLSYLIPYGKEYRRKLKLEVLSHYSNGIPTCASCGETDLRVLCIDHINNDGAKHRLKNKQYEGGKHIHAWLKANNFPAGFQVLCANCNLRKYYVEEETKHALVSG